MLSRGGRSFCEIIRDPNPHEHARPKYLHDFSRNVWIKQKYINKKWVIRTQRFNCIARKILQFSSHTFGYYPHFLRAIFGAYSFSLFGFSVIYFLSRIVGYKLGFVRSPTYRKYLPGTYAFVNIYNSSERRWEWFHEWWSHGPFILDTAFISMPVIFVSDTS